MFVQFSDETKAVICAVFCNAQDTKIYPNQGEVSEDDPRILASGLFQPIGIVEDREAIERAWRDGEIARVTWLRDRHRDELEIGAETTLTSEQYTQLLVYIRALRDWPATVEFPAEESRPAAPVWISEQIQ